MNKLDPAAIGDVSTTTLITNPVAAEGVTVFSIVLLMIYLILPVVTRKIRR